MPRLWVACNFFVSELSNHGSLMVRSWLAHGSLVVKPLSLQFITVAERFRPTLSTHASSFWFALITLSKTGRQLF
jgi:hypothetical protein